MRNHVWKRLGARVMTLPNLTGGLCFREGLLGVILRDKVYWGVIRSSSTLDKPDDKSGDKCDDKSDLKSGDKSDDKADFTSDDKSDDKSNDKADDKSNDKSNDKSDDIHPIRSHNNKGNHKRGGAAEGRATSFVVTAAGRHLCHGFE